MLKLGLMILLTLNPSIFLKNGAGGTTTHCSLSKSKQNKNPWKSLIFFLKKKMVVSIVSTRLEYFKRKLEKFYFLKTIGGWREHLLTVLPEDIRVLAPT